MIVSGQSYRVDAAWRDSTRAVWNVAGFPHIFRYRKASLVRRRFTGHGTTILHGEAIEVLEQDIDDCSVDLIFADPPYNIGKQFSGFRDRWPSDFHYAKWCEQWLGLCIRKLKANGSMYVMTSTQCMPYLDIFLREKIVILSRIIWHYDSSGVQAKSRFGSMYEPIVYCVKDQSNYTFNAGEIKVKAKTGSERKLIDYRKAVPTKYNELKVPGNVWYFPRVRYRMPEYEDHPSQKPEALIERIIKASSNPGDRILDPFAGTFTTNSVAMRLGRISTGIERELEYVKIGLRRLGIQDSLDGESLLPPKKTHVRKNGKHPTNESEAQRGLF